MDDSHRQMLREEEQRSVEPGLGVRCAEAQADGFPCTELGRDCADCEKARPLKDILEPMRGAH